MTLTLNDGTEVTGIVEKVIRDNGKTYLQIEGIQYGIDDITSMHYTWEPTDEAANTGGGGTNQGGGDNGSGGAEDIMM